MSEPEPELGLGIVMRVENYRIWVDFPAVAEQRLYAKDSAALRRIRFHEGESVADEQGRKISIVEIEEAAGLLTYISQDGIRISEDKITGLTDFSAPQERFMKAQVDRNDVFNLRYNTLTSHSKYRQSQLRGLMGGRVELVPHQFSILSEVASRQNPRVLLADEVGMGKTIEACLILQRLLTTGKVSRVLVLVPDALVNQWFVELLRRFNYWFSIFDEERCRALEKGDVDGNPFKDEQLVLCGIDLLTGSEVRAEQAIDAGWDMVVIDEAHHLEWNESDPSLAYKVAEGLAKSSLGLLLLTATPTQLGMKGHFARLRLLDPDRYNSYSKFLKEADYYGDIADVAARILDDKPLRKADKKLLDSIFKKNPDRLEELLSGIEKDHQGAETALLRTLLDEYGTGRVVFRNTREHIQGFPERVYNPVALKSPTEGGHLQEHINKEFEVLAGRNESEIRYDFAQDPRIEWLVKMLRQDSERKVLLICHTQRKALAIKKILDEKSLSFGMFHEGLTLIQRDRNAAYFSEPDGAQLLVCSEIGSEGRNFQFAHDLVLFDLPLDPGLLEQRIGRLDRIGQSTSIHIHVPFIEDSASQIMARWYHEGLNAFESSLKGSEAYIENYQDQLIDFALEPAIKRSKLKTDTFDELLGRARAFRKKLDNQLHDGRDRLIELNSFNPDAAKRLISDIQAHEENPGLRELLFELMEHYGIDVTEHEGNDFHLDSSHAFLEAFPSIPKEGLIASFDRSRAVSREDMAFITQDHPIYRDAVEALLTSAVGTSAFSTMVSEQINLVLECLFVIEPIAESRWQVEQFLSPTPVRIVVDVRGRNRTEDIPAELIREEAKDGNIHRFLEQPMFNFDILKNLISGANRYAQRRADRIENQATEQATESIVYEIRRLTDLKKVNSHIRDEEITLLQDRLEHVNTAIKEARLRLDSIRVVMMGPEEALKAVMD